MREQIKEEIMNIENELKEAFGDLEFIDGTLVDMKTMEDVRPATKDEICKFYRIRILKLKLKNLRRMDDVYRY